MKIALKKCDGLDDWYAIVRAEHDGREWLEQTGQNSFGFRCSERLSPEACIEGDTQEMLEIARAIKAREAVSFKRCAVHFESDGVHFHSPKNSRHDGVVSIEDADEFADQALSALAARKEG